jgi:hypothetical protein
MKRALPTLAGLMFVGACLKHAFGKTPNDVPNDFGNDDDFLPPEARIVASGAPGASASGAGSNHLTLDDDLNVVSFPHHGDGTTR